MKGVRQLAEFDAVVEGHVRAFFAGHDCEPQVWRAGPMRELHPQFRVLEIAPGPRTLLWTYVSVGAAILSQADAQALEFVLQAPRHDPRLVEIVTMVAHYNHRHPLGEGHTVPIGDSWLDRSPSDHLLISKLYPFGPDLERIDAPEGQARVLWLLPITAAERAFKIANGLAALESRFEETGAEYWRPDRQSMY